MRLQPVAALLALAACAGPQRRGTAEVHTAYYRDDEGLQVITVAAAASYRLRRDDRVQLGVLVDRVDFQPVDVVSSASATAAGGSLEKSRLEIAAAYSAPLGGEDAPVRLTGQARASAEPDYLSFSGAVGGNLDLAERNTSLSATLGFGHDQIDPTSVAMGDQGSWPASHQRLTAHAEIAQLLGPRADVMAGVGLSWQSGALASPYRRALVFHGIGFLGTYEPEPERHPGERTRLTGFAGAGLYLGRGVGVHARLGSYVDSWEVVALVPEIEAAVELGARVVATASYRYYRQGRASFYAPRYAAQSTPQTGDRRLGSVDEHLGGLELSLAPTGARDRLELIGWYALSRMSYADLGRSVTAHMASLAVSLGY